MEPKHRTPRRPWHRRHLVVAGAALVAATLVGDPSTPAADASPTAADITVVIPDDDSPPPEHDWVLVGSSGFPLTDVNADGVVTGTQYRSARPGVGFWIDPVAHEPHTFSTVASDVRAVNDAGQIVVNEEGRTFVLDTATGSRAVVPADPAASVVGCGITEDGTTLVLVDGVPHLFSPGTGELRDLRPVVGADGVGCNLTDDGWTAREIVVGGEGVRTELVNVWTGEVLAHDDPASTSQRVVAVADEGWVLLDTVSYFLCGDVVIRNLFTGEEARVPSDSCRTEAIDVNESGVALVEAGTESYAVDARSGTVEPLAASGGAITDSGLIAGYRGGSAYVLQLPLPPASVTGVSVDACASPIVVSWEPPVSTAFRAPASYTVRIDVAEVARTSATQIALPGAAPGDVVDVTSVNAGGVAEPVATSIEPCARPAATSTAPPSAVAAPRFTG